MTDPTRLARSALLALVLTGAAAAPLVAFAPDARACSLEKPAEPESLPAPALAPGIYDLGPLRTKIARDGGILFDALAPGLSDADLLAGITLDVETAQGTKVPGALRIFPGAAASSTTRTLRRLQFLPSDGTFAANATLRVKAAFTRAAPEASVKVPNVPFGGADTWSIEIGTALLADAAVPGVTLQPGATIEMDDTSSPSFTCTLAEPEVSNSCGGSQTITTRKFFARRKNLVIAEQRVVFKDAPGADAYVTTKTRVVMDDGRIIVPETTLLPEQSGFMVPEGVTGQICVEVEVSSPSLPGFPKTARACMTVPDVPQPDQAANDAWVRAQSKACSDVSPPTGLAPASGADADADADGGCHAAPGRAQGTFAWITLGMVVSEVVRRRKRR
jgi:hypothetical protein